LAEQALQNDGSQVAASNPVSSAATTATSNIYDSFAQCITASGAQLYCASWSPNCKLQIMDFGSSTRFLPWVECSTSGASETLACINQGIAAYPTWRFKNGSSSVGVLDMAKLSEYTACSFPKSNTPAKPAQQPAANNLQIIDTVIGTGAEVRNGNTVNVLYTGSLDNGTVFDASSKHGNTPFSFTVGAGTVIKGWDLGLVGMKVGGTRNLVIPSQMAYGASGAGGVIPPNATLHFTIQLLSITTSPSSNLSPTDGLLE
jgi:hypothetical protein